MAIKLKIVYSTIICLYLLILIFAVEEELLKHQLMKTLKKQKKKDLEPDLYQF